VNTLDLYHFLFCPVLAARHAVYQDERQRNPQRWSGSTRNWKPVGAVTLNPKRDIIIRAATSQIQLSGSIGEPAFPFFNRRPFGKGDGLRRPPIHCTRDASRDTSPDARTTTPRRSRRDPRRAIRGLQGAAQGNRRGCAGEAAGGYPIPSARRSAQSTTAVG
jgi:hypothetical protein